MRSRSSGNDGGRPSIFGGSDSAGAGRGPASAGETRFGTPSSGDVNTLIQLEMLKGVNKNTRGRRDSSSDDEVAGSSSCCTGTEGIYRLRRRIRQQPGRNVEDYVDMF